MYICHTKQTPNQTRTQCQSVKETTRRVRQKLGSPSAGFSERLTGRPGPCGRLIRARYRDGGVGLFAVCGLGVVVDSVLWLLQRGGERRRNGASSIYIERLRRGGLGRRVVHADRRSLELE